MILRPEGTQTIGSGSTSITQGVGRAIVGSGTLLASATVTFPPSPSDRDNFIMIFNGGVTLLSLLGGSISILGTPPTTIATGAAIAYEYEASSNKWYRLY